MKILDIRIKLEKIFDFAQGVFKQMRVWFEADIFFGKCISDVRSDSIVFFPVLSNILFCGLAGIVSFKKKTSASVDIRSLNDLAEKVERHCCLTGIQNDYFLDDQYMGGKELIESFAKTVRKLKRDQFFYNILPHNN